MDGRLEKIKRNLGVPSIEDEDQFVKEYEEEIKKSWEEQQTSSIKVLLNQMLSAKEEVEEQDEEAPVPSDTSMEKEVVEGSPHSSEVENYIEEGFIEPSIQKAFDEDNAPTITQHPSLDIQEVKATNKSTEERIVTKLPLNISMKKERSTTSNPRTTNKQAQLSYLQKEACWEEAKEGGIDWLLFILEVIPLDKLEEEEESHQLHVSSFPFLVISIKEWSRFLCIVKS
ncbi:hypothetical protein AHAS_Ahas15G0255100 [Arachis hypogaea]